VHLLLERADVQVNSEDYGWTPLLWASTNGHVKVLGLLIERPDVDMNLGDRMGQTPLSLAASDGNDQIVRLLLERADVRVNSVDKDGWTPLSRASRKWLRRSCGSAT
jgi:ankyrin repeat protein